MIDWEFMLSFVRALFLPGNFPWTLHGVELSLFVILVVDLWICFLRRRQDFELVLISGARRRSFRVRRSLVFGSSPGRGGVTLKAKQVSRLHLEVNRDSQGRLLARDLGSSNGSFRHGQDLRDDQGGVLLEPGDEVELGRGGPVLRYQVSTVRGGRSGERRPGARRSGGGGLAHRLRVLAWLGLLWSGLILGWLANLQNLPEVSMTMGRVTVDFGWFLGPGPMVGVGILASLAGLLCLLAPKAAPEATMAVFVLLALGLSMLYPLLPAVALRYAQAAERAHQAVESMAGPGAWEKFESAEERDEAAGLEKRAARRFDQGRAALRWATNLAAREGQSLVSVTYFRQVFLLILTAMVGLGMPLWFPGAREAAMRGVEGLRRPLFEGLIRAADHGSTWARLLRPIAYWDMVFGFLAAAVVAATLWSPLGTSLGRGKSLYLTLPGVTTLQSVELVKALFVLFVTGYFARQGSLLARVARRRYLVPYALAVLGTLALTGVQADLGGLFMLGLFLGLIFVAVTGQVRLVLSLPLLLLPGLALASVLGVVSVVSTRIGIWIAPRIHPLGEQIVQARQLLLSSGAFGFSPHRGLATQVPDIQGDLVIAAFAERYGWIGLVALIGCWFVLVGSLVKESRRSEGGAAILHASVAALLLVQFLTQAGGVMGLLPLTGVPIPWLSHGLSASLIFTLLISLALATRRTPDTDGMSPSISGSLRYLDWANLASSGALLFLVVFWMVVLPREEHFGQRGRDYLTSGSNRFADRSLPRGAVTTRDGALAALSDDHGRRRYPFAEALYHPIGYGGSLALSRGVEASAAIFLSGRTLDFPARFQAFNADLHQGPEIELTLDSELQRTVFEQLAGRRGAGVAIDLTDGALLVLVSSPAVDPDGAGIDQWRSFADDAARPLLSRATHSTAAYSPPGSVFKIVVAAAVLEGDAIDPKEKTMCRGRDETLRVSCAHGSSHGAVDLSRALVVSCNIYFARAVVRLEPSAILNMAQQFGFNQTESFNLLRGVPKADLRPGISTVDISIVRNSRDLARLGYGQGPVSATPLLIARMGAVVALGGELPDPFLARSLAFVQQQRLSPGHRRRVIAPQTAEALKGPLTEVFERGTARGLDKLWWKNQTGWRLGEPGAEEGWRAVPVAGKTGSAWKTRRDRLDDAWMVAWAPADAPRVVVSVLVEDAGEGGKIAGPIAMRLLRDALETLKHEPEP